jgi:hypothetical protein
MSWQQEPCSRCVAELTSAAAQFRVTWPPDDVDAAEAPQLFSIMSHGRLPEKVALMRRAIEHGWPMELNHWHGGVVVPVTTWQGDPVCEAHLFEAWQDGQQPIMVRMAQWGRPGRR